MAISDYSQTPGSNTSISGTSIAENCPPANVNDAFRQLMADLAVWYAAGGVSGSGGQPLDPTLTALAALITSAGSMIYATGADAFAVTGSTAFGRSLLNTADAATALTALGATGLTIAGTAGSMAITIGTLTLTIKDVTLTGTANTAVPYGNGHTYASWARSWIEGDDGTGEVSVAIAKANMGLTSSTVSHGFSGSHEVVMFSIGA